MLDHLAIEDVDLLDFVLGDRDDPPSEFLRGELRESFIDRMLNPHKNIWVRTNWEYSGALPEGVVHRYIPAKTYREWERDLVVLRLPSGPSGGYPGRLDYKTGQFESDQMADFTIHYADQLCLVGDKSEANLFWLFENGKIDLKELIYGNEERIRDYG